MTSYGPTTPGGVSGIRIEDQPAPKHTDESLPTIQSLVIEDFKTREQVGMERYGVPLRAHDGRISIVDAYQEAIDLVVYLRKVIAEGGLVSRHGADDTPREEGTHTTAGQLLAMILDSDEKERLRICSDLSGNSSLAHNCLYQDHVLTIEQLKSELVDARRAIVRLMSGLPLQPNSRVAEMAQWEVERDKQSSKR